MISFSVSGCRDLGIAVSAPQAFVGGLSMPGCWRAVSRSTSISACQSTSNRRCPSSPQGFSAISQVRCREAIAMQANPGSELLNVQREHRCLRGSVERKAADIVMDVVAGQRPVIHLIDVRFQRLNKVGLGIDARVDMEDLCDLGKAVSRGSLRQRQQVFEAIGRHGPGALDQLPPGLCAQQAAEAAQHRPGLPEPANDCEGIAHVITNPEAELDQPAQIAGMVGAHDRIEHVEPHGWLRCRREAVADSR